MATTARTNNQLIDKPTHRYSGSAGCLAWQIDLKEFFLIIWSFVLLGSLHAGWSTSTCHAQVVQSNPFADNPDSAIQEPKILTTLLTAIPTEHEQFTWLREHPLPSNTTPIDEAHVSYSPVGFEPPVGFEAYAEPPMIAKPIFTVSMSEAIAACASWEMSAPPVALPFHHDDFSPTPLPNDAMQHDGMREQWVYDAKSRVPVQQPWIEWGRIFYGDGITPRGYNWFGSTNLAHPQFYLYGDYRTGISSGRNDLGRTDNLASRLNLDLDLRLTDTERFHAFIGPLTRGATSSQLALVDGELDYQPIVNLNPVTGFFEGDLGAILGGMADESSPFELPFTIGLVPLLFQNGVWMEDAVTGAAFSLPARHSRALNWSNYDATFFAVVDQINSPAFGNDEHAAQAFGTAWFIEAYGGYIESGYAYVRDRNIDERSYHNATISFTRRYFDRISNSIRVIVNAGQDLTKADRTADGTLLLFENSLVSGSPYKIVPYMNLFVGWDRPQSVARAGVSGGILRNTGINFDTDGLNGFATLDTSASDTAGGAIGIDLLGADFDRQLLLELAYLTPHGSSNAAVPDDQFATGARYQFPISHRSLLRFDAMYGWRDGLNDVYGTRMEYRWKF